jgi:hypothetical protein
VKLHNIVVHIRGSASRTKEFLSIANRMIRIRRKHKDCSVFWIPTTDLESLHQAYTLIAQRLGIPDLDDEKVDVKRLVQRHLSMESAGKWLLIYDNVDDASLWSAGTTAETAAGSKSGSVSKAGAFDLIDYLPISEQGRVVFTTRDRKTAVELASRDIVEMPEIDQDTARRMLQEYLVNPDLANEQKEADNLLKELTYLPLAIVQVAAYINTNNITLKEYLSLLAEQEEEIVDLLSEEFKDEWRYCNAKNPVATTWLILFDQIRHRDPLAADYLSFIACIDRNDILQSLLPAGPSRMKEMDAIGTLDAYSFITKRPAESAVDLHRLVHLATRNWLRKQDLLGHWTHVAIARLLNEFPDNSHDNRSKWRQFLPHAIYALASDLVGEDDKVKVNLAWKCAWSLSSDGRYNEAEVYSKKQYTVGRGYLGRSIRLHWLAWPNWRQRIGCKAVGRMRRSC